MKKEIILFGFVLTSFCFAERPNVEQCNIADSPLGVLIGTYESKNNYNIANALSPLRTLNLPLSDMTLAEIRKRQLQGTNVLHATGRFQVIGVTLGSAITYLGLSLSSNDDKSTQDKIFTEYLAYAKRNQLGNYLFGNSDDVEKAGFDVAREWASMPVPQGYPTAKKGTSDGNSAYYGGDGVNPAKAKINFSVLQDALEKTKQQIKDGNCTDENYKPQESDNTGDSGSTTPSNPATPSIIVGGNDPFNLDSEVCNISLPASNAICEASKIQNNGNKIYNRENKKIRQSIAVEKENYVKQENRIFLTEKRNRLILNNQKISKEQDYE